MKLRTLACGLTLSLTAALLLRIANRRRRAKRRAQDAAAISRWEDEGGGARK